MKFKRESGTARQCLMIGAAGSYSIAWTLSPCFSLWKAQKAQKEPCPRPQEISLGAGPCQLRLHSASQRPCGGSSPSQQHWTDGCPAAWVGKGPAAQRPRPIESFVPSARKGHHSLGFAAIALNCATESGTSPKAVFEAGAGVGVSSSIGAEVSWAVAETAEDPASASASGA